MRRLINSDAAAVEIGGREAFRSNCSNSDQNFRDLYKRKVFVDDFNSERVAGTTDDTAAIRKAIAKLYDAGNGGIVEFGYGDYLISSTITIPNGVYLRGQGAASDWSLLGGPFSTVAWGTRLRWTGSSTGGPIFDIGDGSPSTGTYCCGIQRLSIDGKVAVTPTSSHVTGIRIQNAIDCHFYDIAIQKVGVAFNMINASAGSFYKPTTSNTFQRIRAFNCYEMFSLFGGPPTPDLGPAVADNRFIDCIGRNIQHCCLNLVRNCDNNYLSHVFFETVGTGGYAIMINTADPTTDQFAANCVVDGGEIVQAGSATGTILVNNTGTSKFTFKGGIAGNAPVLTNGALTDISEVGRPKYAPIHIPLWAAGVNNNVAAGAYAIFNSACFARIVPHDFVSYFGGETGWFTACVQKVTVDVVWDPATASGGIQLVNRNSGAVIAGPTVPGASGEITTTYDVSSYVQSTWADTGATTTAGQIALHGKGDGVTSPILYRAYVKVWVPI